jgi:plastocyanin domain-containing protein
MLMVNLAGIALIALIVWWFWLYKPREVTLDDPAMVVVVENGSYQPARIKLAANQATRLQFLRKDASPCAETVIFPDLDISATLALGKTASVALPPLPAGEYAFHCQMQMYRGVLIVHLNSDDN